MLRGRGWGPWGAGPCPFPHTSPYAFFPSGCSGVIRRNRQCSQWNVFLSSVSCSWKLKETKEGLWEAQATTRARDGSPGVWGGWDRQFCGTEPLSLWELMLSTGAWLQNHKLWDPQLTWQGCLMCERRADTQAGGVLLTQTKGRILEYKKSNCHRKGQAQEQSSQKRKHKCFISL